MSLYVPSTRDQMSAVDEYNEYCTRNQDLMAEFEQIMMRTLDDLDDPNDIRDAIRKIESDQKFERHVLNMQRLIKRLKEEDLQATEENRIEVAPYWTHVIDHRSPLNPNYEKPGRMVFDMGRKTSVESVRGPSQSLAGHRRRSSTIKMSNNPLGRQ